jgi:lysophospholipase L1-like esterase
MVRKGLLFLILILSLAANITTVGYFVGKRIYYSRWAETHHLPTPQERLTELLKLKPESGDTFFFGTSLTYGFPFKELANSHVKNAGFAGYLMPHILKVIDKLIDKKPKYIFLEGGINDFRYGKSVDKTFEVFKSACGMIKARSPNSRVFIQSVLPTNSDTLNVKIKAYNQKIQDYSMNNGLIYIDTYSKFIENNRINPDLTLDGIHLNQYGYFVWLEQIKKFIN